MKIALTDSWISIRPEAARETYVRNFARKLLRGGHEVHVYTASGCRAKRGRLSSCSVPPFHMLRDYAWALRTRDLLIKEKFDVIHGFGKSVYMDVYRPGGGVRRALARNTRRGGEGEPRRRAVDPAPGTRCGRNIGSCSGWRKYSSQPGGAHEIIAVSNMVRNEIMRYYHCEPERITVIHNGADLARFTPDLRERFRKPARQELGLAGQRDHDPARRPQLQAQRRAVPDSSAAALRRLGMPFRAIRSGARPPSSLRPAGPEARRQRPYPIRRPEQPAREVLRCGGHLLPAEPLRSLRQRPARGARLRPARRHEHHERLRRTAHGQGRLRRPVRRRAATGRSASASSSTATAGRPHRSPRAPWPRPTRPSAISRR